MAWSSSSFHLNHPERRRKRKQYHYLPPYPSQLPPFIGCENYRMWGKLQILGLGTELKILVSVDDKNYSSD
ncbi:hypothetical protein Lal_00037618 [Lupinus albus]|uniref:Putative endoplasmic reticulum oxidoreductin 1 n=1 Tax=Lupinus albus TaxID=3870 RepID=A0A6A4NTR0_LUPAL|nr:putative endoplasmic reticulum oxidoreductin 1 [Lupinus albus]KAF1860280.1 hypothetical protein Lal_00037618 [Lupinus albus]